MNEILTVASRLLQPAADRYKAKSTVFYPTMRDKWGDYIGEVEADEQSTICEDCYDKAKLFFRAQHKLGKYKSKGCFGVQLEREWSPEREDMCICGFCGEHIDVGLLFRFAQEVDHWMENVNDEQLLKDCADPRDAYQLTNILTSYDAYKHILDDVMLLAIRIIRLHN